jgi:hypothetical protein
MRTLCALLALLAVDSVESLERVQTIPLAADTHHVQGIVVEGSSAWVSAVDAKARRGLLMEFSVPTGRLVRTVELQEGERFHPGGISADETSLWVPIAEYRRESSAIIQRRNKKTLAVEFQFEVADHIGCIAVTSEHVIGGNWDTRAFYVWNRRGELIRKVTNETGNAFQDMKFVGGQIVGGGLLADKLGAIDWLDYPSLRQVRRMLAGKTDRGVAYTHEGIAIENGTLWLLPEDSPSQLFGFRLPPVTIRKVTNLPGDGR